MQFHPDRVENGKTPVVSGGIATSRSLKPLKYPLDPEICLKAARYAIRVCEEMSKRSVLLNRDESPEELSVALFEREEILPNLGELLGKGGFNSVYELDRVTLTQQREGGDAVAAVMNSQTQRALRHRVATGSTPLAVKFLSDDALYQPEEFCNGAADLLMEAKYLTALAAHPHPSLIQLHGVGRAGPSGFSITERAGFFLVIDRLYDTLDRRLDVWRELERRQVAGKKDSVMITGLFIQRLLVAQDIASALRHLHKVNIIFRDLKPDNVGFDFEGRVKLFDFGLAKELDPRQRGDDGLYHMSGGTGSRRFMAPEVALSEPYNLSADVYSFSILLWELLTMEKAFANLPAEEHRERVIKSTERPPLNIDWSPELQRILTSCWARQPFQRPRSRDVYRMLLQEIQELYEVTFNQGNEEVKP